ncbi:hypothetical protein ABEB36_015138 [Hypothenemus hampei]|uniref:Uncharacterized protein n=1 Tax=Hypothenemus hampei TaxID=57062 RepID=A0ABD1E0S8_HYPHA
MADLIPTDIARAVTMMELGQTYREVAQMLGSLAAETWLHNPDCGSQKVAQPVFSTVRYNMDVEEIIIVYLLPHKKRKAKKRYWIHPLLLERHSKDLCNNYFKDLRSYEDR